MCLRHQSVNTFRSSAPPPKKNPGSAPATVRSVNHRLRLTTSSPPFSLRDSKASKTRARVKITPREKRRHASGREKNTIASRLFSRGVIFTRALTFRSLYYGGLLVVWVNHRDITFIGGNVENTHGKRTVRYKSQLICIYICHQFFFIRTSRMTLFSIRALNWNVFWNTWILPPSFLFSSSLLSPHLAFSFKTNTPFKTPATRLIR